MTARLVQVDGEPEALPIDVFPQGKPLGWYLAHGLHRTDARELASKIGRAHV